MPGYYDEFDIAMDWFYEPWETDADNDSSPMDVEEVGNPFEETDEAESDEEELAEDEEVEEPEWSDGEAEVGAGEEESGEVGEDGFDLATGELPEDFKQVEVPWWVELKASDSPEEAHVGIHQEELVGNHKRWVQKFPDATQFLNFIYSPLELKNRYSVRASKSSECLGLTWEAAREQADRGWPEGLARVDAIAAKIKRVVAGAIRTPVTSYGIRGPKMDMGRFLTGDPRHALVLSESERMKETKKPRVIRIVTTVDIASNEGFINRGAAICALSQLLQRHGIRTQIDAHVGTDNKIDTWVRLKDVDRSTNMESLVFYTAHPVMFWRYAYAAWEHAPSQWRGNVGTSSMGYISEPHVEDRGDVYVSARGSRWINSEKEMLAWVVAELEKAGIEVELEGKKL